MAPLGIYWGPRQHHASAPRAPLQGGCREAPRGRGARALSAAPTAPGSRCRRASRPARPGTGCTSAAGCWACRPGTWCRCTFCSCRRSRRRRGQSRRRTLFWSVFVRLVVWRVVFFGSVGAVCVWGGGPMCESGFTKTGGRGQGAWREPVRRSKRGAKRQQQAADGRAAEQPIGCSAKRPTLTQRHVHRQLAVAVRVRLDAGGKAAERAPAAESGQGVAAGRAWRRWGGAFCVCFRVSGEVEGRWLGDVRGAAPPIS